MPRALDPVHRADGAATIAYYGFSALAGATLVALSGNIGSIDQSDYPRAVSFMLAGDFYPFRPPIDEWPIRETIASPLWTRSTTSLYFGALALVQRALWGFFSVTFMAAVSKTIALVFGAMAIDRLGRICELGVALRAACFVLFATLLVAAHSSFIFASFYQEHLFYVAIPAVLWACLDPVRWRRNVLLVVLLGCCAAAKVQYFYLPLLFLLVHGAVAGVRRERVDVALCAGLVALQVACLAPLQTNREQKANRYHSLYFGSYLVASADELDRIGVAVRDRPCIGVDAYTNRVEGQWFDRYSPGHRSCIDEHALSLRDVLRPYAVQPAIGLRLWRSAAPAHWTVFPFHLDRRLPYIVPLHGTAFGRSEWMLRASEIREAIVTPAYPWISLLSIAVAAAVGRSRGRNGGALLAIVLFLNLFLYSQIVVALLGEGIRDLGKHLITAQLALDLLVVVTFAMGDALVVAAMRRRSATIG